MAPRDEVAQIGALLERLFPLPRSLAGPANRETLRLLSGVAPLTLHEYPSGTRVYDWTVPREWTVREAWIRDAASGRVLLDLTEGPLHVVTGSVAVSGRMSYEALAPRLHTLPHRPAAVPYRTSYYREDWGFCLSHERLERDFAPGREYEVRIDSRHEDGAMTVADLVLPGAGPEFLVSTYICHPSLANDNLTGPVLAAFLARRLAERPLRRGVRFVFAPETVGAVAYCAHNEAAMGRIRDGFVVTCAGGPGPLGYKASFEPGARVDRAVERAFADAGLVPLRHPFDVHGSDERQFASPGLRIRTATICKDKYYEYPQYHTSEDDLSFVRPENVALTLDLYEAALRRLDADVLYERPEPHCEAMLSRHGLYPALGGAYLPEERDARRRATDAALWLLFACDGDTSLDQVAERSGLDAALLGEVAARLTDKGLLRDAQGPGGSGAA